MLTRTSTRKLSRYPASVSTSSLRQKNSLLGPARSAESSTRSLRLKLERSTALADRVGLRTGLISGVSNETPSKSGLATVKPENRLGAEAAMLGCRYRAWSCQVAAVEEGSGSGLALGQVGEVGRVEAVGGEKVRTTSEVSIRGSTGGEVWARVSGGGGGGASVEPGPGEPGIGERMAGPSEERTLLLIGPKKKCFGLKSRSGVLGVGDGCRVRTMDGNGPDQAGLGEVRGGVGESGTELVLNDPAS